MFFDFLEAAAALAPDGVPLCTCATWHRTLIRAFVIAPQAGELFDFLNVRGRLHEHGARRFFQQLITGVEACHAAGAPGFSIFTRPAAAYSQALIR